MVVCLWACVSPHAGMGLHMCEGVTVHDIHSEPESFMEIYIPSNIVS